MCRQVTLKDMFDAFFNPAMYPGGTCLSYTDAARTLEFQCVLQGDESEIYYQYANSEISAALWEHTNEKLIICGDQRPPYDEYLPYHVIMNYIDRFLSLGTAPSFRVLNNHYYPFECSFRFPLPLIFQKGKIISISEEEYNDIYKTALVNTTNPISMLEFIKILPDGTYSEGQIDKLRQVALDCKLAGTMKEDNSQ